MLSTGVSLDRAYSTLVSVVRSFELGGRPCFGALLKPEFLRALGMGITERSLGFRRFGDFLRAAQASGHIVIKVYPGKDLEVSLPSNPSLLVPPYQPPLVSQQKSAWTHKDPASQSVPQISMHVRTDLWRAFNATSSGWLYDVQKDLAHRPFLDRISSQDEGNTLIAIPSTKARMNEWMRSFTDIQETELRTSLLYYLEKSPFQFQNFLRSKPALLRSWRRYHVQQVVAEIHAWADANKINPIDVVTNSREGILAETVPSVSTLPNQERPTSKSPDVERSNANQLLTSRLSTLIDQMIDELARLRGILEITNPQR